MRRPVWPLLAVPGAAFVFAALVLFGLGIWVDGRFAGTGAILLAPAAAFLISAGIQGEAGTHYTRKTRAMRKAERAADERAYIKKLERELGL